AYLIYLGLKLWRAPDSLADEAAGAVVSGPKMALHAFAVTATNPKSILFFVAFLPQFLDPAAALGPQLAAMAATFVGLATLNAAAYVLIAAQARRRLTRPGALKWVNRAGGVGLIGMGLAAAFAKRG
ncbi:MAG: LysE family translocator, partial [Pseudomonadota bacterium]